MMRKQFAEYGREFYHKPKFLVTAVHLFPSWLVWGRNNVHCACCPSQTAHKLVCWIKSRQKALRAYCSNIPCLRKNPKDVLIKNRIFSNRILGWNNNAECTLMHFSTISEITSSSDWVANLKL